ncbi:MAG TPA: hypothetical protein VJI13_04115 [Candidatus Norongarragalinales archaeon]|nr:hypothetical protein [Candidatus Norongarragalinales archaeon]
MKPAPGGHERLVELLMEYSKGDLACKKILVIGDRHGFLTDHLLHLGADAHGIDRHEKGFSGSAAYKQGRLIRANARNLGLFGGIRFDYVVSNATMTPDGLSVGRFPRMEERISWDMDPEDRELRDKMRSRAFAADAVPVHSEIFRMLKPGGTAIHAADAGDQSISPRPEKLREIGYEILQSEHSEHRHELVLRKPLKMPEIT